MIELRKATVEDARLLASTRRIVWQETYRGIYPDEMLDHYDLERHAQKDAQRISDPHHHYYLFLDGNDCVGYFSYGPYNYGAYKDFDLCLNHLYIRKEYKGMGLGRQAFQHLRNFCGSQEIKKFFCGCNVHNHAAVAFYQHMGGIQGDTPEFHNSKADDIMHFEFYLGV